VRCGRIWPQWRSFTLPAESPAAGSLLQAAELQAELQAAQLRSQMQRLDGDLARQQSKTEQQQQDLASKRARLEASAAGDVASLQARASRQGLVQLSVSGQQPRRPAGRPAGVLTAGAESFLYWQRPEGFCT
jgi:hypothetical protein